ncbi:MAG: hypothetical protein IPH72_34845 [Sandaracinaceae bacterium]|nr:hypothetical protein [Sandaracinaceae bacterium]
MHESTASGSEQLDEVGDQRHWLPGDLARDVNPHAVHRAQLLRHEAEPGCTRQAVFGRVVDAAQRLVGHSPGDEQRGPAQAAAAAARGAERGLGDDRLVLHVHHGAGGWQRERAPQATGG